MHVVCEATRTYRIDAAKHVTQELRGGTEGAQNSNTCNGLSVDGVQRRPRHGIYTAEVLVEKR